MPVATKRKAKLSNQTNVKIKHAEIDADRAVENLTKILTGDTDKAQASDQERIGARRLESFIERIERLEEEKSALSDDIKEVFAEAKSVGFDVKTIRRILALRKMDDEKRREAYELLKTYASAIDLQYPLL